ncbi:menaquinone biosynthesis protein [Desulfurobacterium thermolithotrophum]|uniref:menaquinone biosynthesis protein n=1 Tax=Desulfurobacterium thermolithotrophum TaxID=64160 RepID=UPI0013D30674|nr:menaquinone biosynthesis protein [Desulfurobacterium thermolithotrophum]
MLRVGKIEYLNTIPVYYGFLSGKVDSSGVVFVEEVPSELNKMLREGKLDISVISSYEYLKNNQNYLLLPNLSISAKKKVISVLFLSTVPIHQLHRKDVWLTRSSMTSRELLKYLLREVYGIEPNYRFYSLKEGNLPKNPTALLTIGDDALKMIKTQKFPFVYDLAEEWFNLFSLPFVFAVWAVRKDSFREKREEVITFYEKLIKSKKIGLNSYKEICENYSSKISICKDLCKNYLKQLIYDLNTEELNSMKKFSKVINVVSSFQFIPTN